MKFKKKPIVIEAMQYKDGNEYEIMKWAHNGLPDTANSIIQNWGGYFVVRTLEGNFVFSENDWIVKGVNGEFYPVKPDIFEKTYEAVSE